MKVLNLFCVADHAFEGWFGSEQEFQEQLQRGLLQCPLCGSTQVRKGLSAPRLNLGQGSTPAAAAQPALPQPAPPEAAHPAQHPAQHLSAEQQRQWLQAARQIMQQTEDVGERFADQARRMHHGEIESRAIRGQASVQQTLELLDEGVAVLPLLLPDSAKETLQ